MALDAGGIFFNAIAFNGWYMSTEIVRDLLEPNRYNKLNVNLIKINLQSNLSLKSKFEITIKIIAKTFGLDINTSLALWKDETILELNKAIMHSFNKAGVTIVDHHAAADSFVKHLENEFRLRGGTPADWVFEQNSLITKKFNETLDLEKFKVWINPPTAGHITRVFGMEMLNYNVRPYYEYQVILCFL